LVKKSLEKVQVCFSNETSGREPTPSALALSHVSAPSLGGGENGPPAARP